MLFYQNEQRLLSRCHEHFLVVLIILYNTNLTVFAKIVPNSTKVFTNLCGETYKIIVRVSSAKANNEFDVLSGKNPSKINLSLGNPLLTKAGTNAVAPGKHSTSTRFQHKSQ
jgi:hypothetical protein